MGLKALVVVNILRLIDDVTSSPRTHEELTKILVVKLPKGYKKIDIVADCYRSPKLFKNGVGGNQADESIIPSLQSRVHPDFKTTLLYNHGNKTGMIELIFDYTKTEALQYLELLDSQGIVLPSEDECHKI